MIKNERFLKQTGFDLTTSTEDPAVQAIHLRHLAFKVTYKSVCNLECYLLERSASCTNANKCYSYKKPNSTYKLYVQSAGILHKRNSNVKCNHNQALKLDTSV